MLKRPAAQKALEPDNKVHVPTAVVYDIKTKQPMTLRFNSLLVGEKIVSEEEARSTFQAKANQIGLKGQVVGQFIAQSLMQAENLGVEFLAAQAKRSVQNQVADTTITIMGMQQQSGGIINMTDAERKDLRERQLAAQREMMTATPK